MADNANGMESTSQDVVAIKTAKMLDTPNFVEFLARIDPSKDFEGDELERYFTSFNEANEAFTVVARYIDTDFSKVTGIKLSPDNVNALRTAIQELAINDPERVKDLITSVKDTVELPKKIEEAEKELERINGTGPLEYSKELIDENTKLLEDLVEYEKGADLFTDIKDWFNKRRLRKKPLMELSKKERKVFDEYRTRDAVRDRLEENKPGITKLRGKNLRDKIDSLRERIRVMKSKAEKVENSSNAIQNMRADLGLAGNELREIVRDKTAISKILKRVINAEFSEMPNNLRGLGEKLKKAEAVLNMRRTDHLLIDQTLDTTQVCDDILQNISQRIGEEVSNTVDSITVRRGNSFTPFMKKLETIIAMGSTIGYDGAGIRETLLRELETKKADLILPANIANEDNRLKLVMVKGAIASLKASNS